MFVKKYLSHSKMENGWLIHADCADILIVFLTDDIVRMRVSFERNFPEASYALVTTAWEDRLDPLFEGERQRVRAREIPCEERENSLCFQTASMKLVMKKAPVAFTAYNKADQVIYKDLPARAFDKDQLGRLTHYSCMDREKDHFYGFGEKTGHLDKKFRRLRMCPKDAIGVDPETGDPMYKHIPFYIRVNEKNNHAVGVFYNNSYDCVFDLGEEISGYWERYNYYQTDGGDLDIFLMNGPSVKDVIGQYTLLTGRTILPTKQSLGYCASTMYYAELEKDCDVEIYNVIDKHEKEKIWIDNFWLASGYTSGEEDNLRYTFNWNHRRFPKPEEFFEKMNARGINVICNLKPGVLPNHPYRGYYEDRDVFVKEPDSDDAAIGQWWGGQGRFIDFTLPEGRRAWRELLEENILRKGTKTVWNDNCEYDSIEDRNARCSFEGAGGTMAELTIIQSNMMAWTAHKAIANVWPNERPYVINRAGYAGIQRYAQVWGGDNITGWKTVKFNIATILGMGLSGCANMGCDIGGFTGPAPDGELLLRWIQNGIFQPRFVINSANTDNSVTQPWQSEENLPYVREAYAQRYRMLPYLYSLMREASVSGIPAMRPLFLEFPDDPACYKDERMTFLFGPSVLVANVLEPGAKERTLYLPKGCKWYDMNDNFRAYEGGQIITVPVDLGSIPMFLRGNAVYFTSEDIHHILSDTLKTLDLVIGADADSEIVFYDDDGHTQNYKHGEYAATRISVKAGDRKIIAFRKEGSYAGTVERINLKLISKEKGAYWVSVAGKPLTRYIVSDGFEAADEGWFYNMSERSIQVKCRKPEKDEFDIVVSTEKFDLIGMADE